MNLIAKKIVLFILLVSVAVYMLRCGPRKSQLMSEGERLYRSKCRACHHIVEPTRYNDKEWVMQLEWMGPRTGLDENQARLILEYLQSANGEK